MWQPSCARYVLATLLVLACVRSARSQDQNLYLTTNTLVARALAMGGAYVGVEDALAAGLYNPANSGGYRLENHVRFRFFLNPLTPALAFTRRAVFFNEKGQALPQTLAALGLLLKGFTLRTGSLDWTAIVGEQATSFSALPNENWKTAGYWDNQYSVMAVRMRLAERVTVGGGLSLHYYSSTNAPRRTWKVLASYGISLAPSRRVLLGVSYLTVPMHAMSGQRDHPERIVDGSINLGLSYHPASSTTVSFDLRNVVEDGNGLVRREPHLGLEYRFAALFAVRGGAFYKREEERAVLSAGLGLFDFNWPHPRTKHTDYSHWAINYGVVAERMAPQRYRFIHALSVAFRI